jgi:hypothetical protein
MPAFGAITKGGEKSCSHNRSQELLPKGELSNKYTLATNFGQKNLRAKYII